VNLVSQHLLFLLLPVHRQTQQVKHRGAWTPWRSLHASGIVAERSTTVLPLLHHIEASKESCSVLNCSETEANDNIKQNVRNQITFISPRTVNDFQKQTPETRLMLE
jgi:hypothetical protein